MSEINIALIMETPSNERHIPGGPAVCGMPFPVAEGAVQGYNCRDREDALKVPPVDSSAYERAPGRRWFLRGTATTGIASLLQRLLGGKGQTVRAADTESTAQPPSLPDRASDDELPYRAYVPLASSHSLAHGPSKLGPHTIGADGAVDFVQGVHQAGAHVALVKAVNEFGYLRQVKTHSPETVTIGRSTIQEWVNPAGDPATKASQLMAQHMPKWAFEKDVVDYWEVLNENDPPTVEGHAWLAQFFKAAMPIAEANGYRLALFSYSVGVPKWDEWQAIVDTGVFARAKAGGHILALHEYNWPVMNHRWGEAMAGQPAYEDRGVLTGRYRHLYRDFLIPRDEVVPLAITECGLDPVLWQPGQPTNHWQERFVDEMIWYDTRLREDDYVIGAAMFTLGGNWGWEIYDYEELLPDFHEYIVSLNAA